MISRTIVKSSHKPVKDYYKTLATYSKQGVTHEQAVRSAFQNLLAETSKKLHWTLIPELSDHVQGRRIVPDGTVRDSFNLPRGHWEAKDTADDLDAEIRKKIQRGYPLDNIIFEDTQTGVLFQNGREVLRADLTDAAQLTHLLNSFFDHEQPDIEKFERAVDEFQTILPDLGKGLVDIIHAAHKSNKTFVKAFNEFFTLCKESLNPNIRREAVEEMLVQHLMTERLLRTIFDVTDFTRKNVIAGKVEEVIDALTSTSFSRRDFLKSLDRFYVAIEEAAKGLDDFSEKQHFLNTVYERFFQGYSVKVADTHGIVYTPQPIVDFMVNSVQEVLRDEFGMELWDEGVHILDPCTGTGNFIVNILNRIPKRHLERFYKNQLFANEVMLLPYYIAALNIEHAYYDKTGIYEPFEGLCFIDTLDLAEAQQTQLGFMTEKNTERVEREKKAPITVIIGNPPYNVGQLNENDNNKNRKYEVVDQRVRDTYAKDSNATSKIALFDSYVKFFRWATDRLEGRDGIISFVSNNSFIENKSFDGMRKHFQNDFNRIYLVDLKGNIRKDSMRDGIPLGEKNTVFGIAAMVGISITMLVRMQDRTEGIEYFEVPFRATREDKFAILKSSNSVSAVNWSKIEPSKEFRWLVPNSIDQFMKYSAIGNRKTKSDKSWKVETIFKIYSMGVRTSRDDITYDLNKDALLDRVYKFIEFYNSEVMRYYRSDKRVIIDDFVNYKNIKWSESLKNSLKTGIYVDYDKNKCIQSLYRPFTKLWLYFDAVLNERRYLNHLLFPSDNMNLAISATDPGSEKPFVSLISNLLADVHVVGAGAGAQCFPFYVYDEDGSNRRENITDWALGQFRERYSDPSIEKWDIFYYVYGLLHHPGYRSKYADCLKLELPRIPYAPDFREFEKAGRELADLHLRYEELEPWELEWEEAEDLPLSYHVEKMKLTKDKCSLIVNETLTLHGIPQEVFGYRLGNRSALDWIIDQYRVKTDKRSGITHDPNRDDDPEYIVRLVGQIVRVSLETVRIVNGLPEEFEP